jgi:hypothetical protein
MLLFDVIKLLLIKNKKTHQNKLMRLLYFLQKLFFVFRSL